jgi:DNA-binding PucR family transcriptional regulator
MRRASEKSARGLAPITVAKPDVDTDAGVTGYVAETAARLQDRLAQVSSAIQVSLQNEIPELGDARRVLELLGPSVEGNVDTLRVFLRCGSSYKQAADELNLHFNTVKYRVGRAVARRGREVADDRLDVEVALLVCHWYDAAVLPPCDS